MSEINYKAKLQIQILMEKLNLTFEQKDILEEILKLEKEVEVTDLEKLLENAEEKGYNIGYADGLYEKEDEIDDLKDEVVEVKEKLKDVWNFCDKEQRYLNDDIDTRVSGQIIAYRKVQWEISKR